MRQTDCASRLLTDMMNGGYVREEAPVSYEMFRDTTDLTRRVTTHLVMRNQKPLQADGWVATALLVAVTLASSAVTAASGEQFCTHGG
jgi:hypothetical protein